MSPTINASTSTPPSISSPHCGGTYPCDLVFEKEDDGGYSVYVSNLPGAASQGDSLEEATDNIREAIRGLLDEYTESNMPIPWRKPLPVDPNRGAISKRIFVDG